jgi:hypothetical protein
VQQAVTMPVAGALATRLVAAAGDWDVAVFKADTGDVVAGSASRGGREVASGFAVAGERLIAQACRLDAQAGARSAARQQETYTLYCEQPEGVIRSARQVFVQRGGRRSLDLRTDCKVRR